MAGLCETRARNGMAYDGDLEWISGSVSKVAAGLQCVQYGECGGRDCEARKEGCTTCTVEVLERRDVGVEDDTLGKVKWRDA